LQPGGLAHAHRELYYLLISKHLLIDELTIHRANYLAFAPGSGYGVLAAQGSIGGFLSAAVLLVTWEPEPKPASSL